MDKVAHRARRIPETRSLTTSFQAAISVEAALLFRITHIDNVAHIARVGQHCAASKTLNAAYVGIGNSEIIARRAGVRVPIPPGGTLSDYVPFYFTPCSPMLYRIVTGHRGHQRRERRDIVILITSLDALETAQLAYMVADRNATLNYAKFTAGREDLVTMPWEDWRNRDFKRDANDPERFDRYQAEVLVHNHLPVAALTSILTFDAAGKAAIDASLAANGLHIPVHVRPDWYL